MRKIKRALISVSNKSNLEALVKELNKHDVEIISTGGTAKFIKEITGSVTQVSEFTGEKEILGGRVKTLNPKIHGGILAKRDDVGHEKELIDNNIGEIDLVVVNLYPFEEVIAKDHSFSDAIENIDIGGPTMIRAAAKNFSAVTVLTDPNDYELFIDSLSSNDGSTDYEFRKKMAIKAFARIRDYDVAISSWFNPDSVNINGKLKQKLRYGENPHQKAELYQTDEKGIINAEQIQGKELSYNNINDVDAAYKLNMEFSSPAVCIIKHANPCAVAQANNINDAYKNALSCDPVSSFGGIVAINRKIEEDLAIIIKSMFYEVIICPGISDEAREVLKSKKNMRILLADFKEIEGTKKVKSVLGGVLVQDDDKLKIEKGDLHLKTKLAANDKQIANMLLAWKVVKHVKSNAILFAIDDKVVAIGAGQMSRVDAVRVAKMKLEDYCKKNKISKDDLVMASDAFFPFADGLEIGIEAGVKAVIQPGGSVRDQEVIEAADRAEISMYFTNIRHFNH